MATTSALMSLLRRCRCGSIACVSCCTWPSEHRCVLQPQISFRHLGMLLVH
jgi:hypothetical protein